jgi:hypothetical protein
VIARIAAAIAGIGIVAAVGIGAAQTATRFDGIYDLRSTSLVPGAVALNPRRPCSLELHAEPLHIVGSHATMTFHRTTTAAGDVSPQGVFLLMDLGARLEFTGKIDIHGELRGYLNTFDGCGYDLILRKRPQ